MNADVPVSLVAQIGLPSDLERRLWGDRADEQLALKAKRTVEQALRAEGVRGAKVAFQSTKPGYVTVTSLDGEGNERLVTLSREMAQAIIGTMKHPRDLYTIHERGQPTRHIHIGDLVDALLITATGE